MMKLRALIVVIWLALLTSPPLLRGADSPYKIRIGFPSLAFSYLPYYVAQEKGFLKKYGLDSEYIQMRTAIQPQAVVNGNINYLTSVSTGISAAVAGLPLVIVINFCDTSPWVLVTQKNINKPQDFVGKTVALSGIRTSPYYFFQAFLK
jgi:ABC-type nitrate/sulfonate/bicarbonate transport system substrate-binding protein